MPTLRRSTEPVVLEAFSFLPARGIALTAVHEGSRELSFRFESELVRVSIIVESGAEPSVSVLDRTRGRAYALLFIVQDARPDLLPLLTTHRPKLEEKLRDLARALQEAGEKVLAGDFSRAPELAELAAAWRRDDNRKRFGSVTGEHPRFETRPSLAQLFEDAKNEGLRDARTYQAVWDWNFSEADIAAFLRCTEADVRARLQRWDGLG